ncbi:hypothetical protein GZ77_19345 [Endozoicomonas montiporae]|uniref:Uncharacterized protein n=2 Tax=Endozoicomonas montiporae TaxID=1027273 RepID=A0A081N2I0_9GAMM|nr:hypothetical protein [Endozoicomonas montiporae]KEQ12653.1 hypothetical protein GZ77_19345 [Endozoicomonas montiporae]
MKWAENFGGNYYNKLSRSLTSHSNLLRLNQSGGWFSGYEKQLYEQYKKDHYNQHKKDIDLVNSCPACLVALIRGLDHNLFSIPQHVSLINLLEKLKITRHYFGLASIVLLTQNQEGSTALAPEQRLEAQKWLLDEGEEIKERHNPVTGMKSEIVEYLHQLEMYQTLIPSASQHSNDHSLLLGGSIQQMQIRFIGMIAFYDNYGIPEQHDGYRPYEPISRVMGKVTTLTCDRVVNSGKLTDQVREVDEDYDSVWFEIDQDGMTDISYHQKTHLSTLTEDTAYRAIVHGVRKMCDDEQYFDRKRRSIGGYHPKQKQVVTSYLPEQGVTSYLYHKLKKDYSFVLTDKFKEASCRFLSEHRDHPDTFMTPEKPIGASSIKRPTTKQTVKEWMKARSPCKGKKVCHITTFSSQPNARYQQVAVLQGVEEEIDNLDPTKILVSIGAFGASTEIPIIEALDNLSRTLFMIQRRPKR